MAYTDAITLADTLRNTANSAANALEKMALDADTAKSANLGVLPDGTPIEDMLSELADLKKDYAHLRHDVIRQIKHLASTANSKTAYTTIKAIEEIVGKIR